MVLHANNDWSKMDLRLGLQGHKDSISQNSIIYWINFIDICGQRWQSILLCVTRAALHTHFLLYYMFLGGKGWLFFLIIFSNICWKGVDGKGKKALVGNEKKMSNEDFHCQYQRHEKTLLYLLGFYR